MWIFEVEMPYSMEKLKYVQYVQLMETRMAKFFFVK
jgi:hypothetical protein